MRLPQAVCFYAWRYKKLQADARNRDYVVRCGRRLRKVLFDSGLFKVFWSSYQIIAATGDNLGVRFPRPYADVQRFIAKLTQISFLSLVPSSCLLGESVGFLHELHVAVWAPIVLSVVVLVLSHLLQRSKKKWKALPSKGVGGILFIFSIIAPSTSLKLFQYQVCTKLADGSWWLTADLSLQCPWYAGVPSNSAYVTVAVGWLVYPIGFPLLLFYLLCGRAEARNALLADKASTVPGMRKYSYIYEVYQPYVAPWFEGFDMLRRMVLCGLIAFMGPPDAGSEYYVAVRAAAGMVLSLLVATFYREVMPYRRSNLNTMMSIGGYCILLTYAMAFIIDVEPWGEMNEDQLSIVGWLLVLLALPIASATGVRMLIELKQQLSLERHRQKLDTMAQLHVEK